jgi:hypothetical protein
LFRIFEDGMESECAIKTLRQIFNRDLIIQGNVSTDVYVGGSDALRAKRGAHLIKGRSRRGVTVHKN